MAKFSPSKDLTARERVFAHLVSKGLSNTEAYRRTYQSKASAQRIAEMAHVVAHRPRVQRAIKALGELTVAKTLLTLNERLGILAEVAQTRGKGPGHLNAKTRAIEVYSKISGDQAPDRHEVSGPNGSPIPVAATTLVGRLPIREKMRLMREAREREKAADLAANTPTPNAEPQPAPSSP